MVVDKAPSRFHSIHTLFLSNNRLRGGLSAFKQFTNLRTLSLSHNELEQMDDILVDLASAAP